MLALRLQRTGRKGYAQYRLVAQDSHRHPSSGKVAAYLGNYDPHGKKINFDQEKIKFYLDHGAQPSERVAKLLKSDGVKLPDWVAKATVKQRSIKNPEKLRKNQPKEEAPKEAEVSADDTAPAEEIVEAEPVAAETTEATTQTTEDTAEVAEVTEAEPQEDKTA